MSYQPPPGPPTTDDLGQVVQYLKQELDRISESQKIMQVDGVNFTTLQALPDKPRTGLVAKFAAGVVTAAALEGLYRMNEAGNWVRIG